MCWTIISWCWLSATDILRTLTQIVLSVVLSSVLHGLYIYLGFLVFVCLCAAVYGVIKNNNLVRLSSIVPFHIIYQVNLYWRNISAHKYNYFETLFHTLAFHTNFSRILHPCKLVPHFHVSHFQSPRLDYNRHASVECRLSKRGHYNCVANRVCGLISMFVRACAEPHNFYGERKPACVMDKKHFNQCRWTARNCTSID